MAAVTDADWKAAKEEITQFKEGYEQVFNKQVEQEATIQKQAAGIIDQQGRPRTLRRCKRMKLRARSEFLIIGT